MTASHLERARAGAAVAALVLAVLSRGDALVLAALLMVTAWRLSALAVVPALIASSWRWGSTSLDALAGAQAVLGPAGFVGPVAAAAASWLGAVAILVSTPVDVGGMTGPIRSSDAPNLLISVIAAGASGAAAAAVVVGPAPGGDLWIRIVGTVVATGVALALARWRSARPRADRAVGVVAVVAAVGALGMVTRNAPAWSGTIDEQAVGHGVVLAVATAALVTVGGLTRAAMGQRTA